MRRAARELRAGEQFGAQPPRTPSRSEEESPWDYHKKSDYSRIFLIVFRPVGMRRAARELRAGEQFGAQPPRTPSRSEEESPWDYHKKSDYSRIFLIVFRPVGMRRGGFLYLFKAKMLQ
jgi:hypothetical protein